MNEQELVTGETIISKSAEDPSSRELHPIDELAKSLGRLASIKFDIFHPDILQKEIKGCIALMIKVLDDHDHRIFKLEELEEE